MATPEKVKSLLSSFLVQPNQSPPSRLASSEQSSPKSTLSTLSCDGRNKQTPEQAMQKQSRPSSGSLRSYEKFLERLESFSSVSWCGKPLELSPLVCSRFGWENVDTNMLCCVSCKALLNGHLPSRLEAKIYEESVSTLQDKLRTSHDKFCVLAANPCPEHFCQVATHDPASLLSSFVERASTLSCAQEKLPPMDCSGLNKLGYDEGQTGAYCKRHLMTDKELSLETVALAATGWTLSSTISEVLQCCQCRRRVGLWTYRPSSPTPPSSLIGIHKEQEDSEPSVKKRRITTVPKKQFDPLGEHRLWCPWLQDVLLPSTSSSHGAKQNTEQKLPAWMVALREIAPGLMDGNTGLAHAMKTSSMMEGLRCFRRVINGWSSPKASMEKSPS